MARYVVIGATGQQGGSVIDALEGTDHQLVAFVRDAGSEKARALDERGVELAVGSLDDQASIESAFAGADAAFAVTTFFATSTAVEAEHGTRLADAAAAAALPFLVYSSVGSANLGTGIGHFESKAMVERRIGELGIPAAIVAPTWFMENVLFPWNLAGVGRGIWRQAMPEDVPLQMVSTVDIGRSVAAIMQRPGDFIGRRFELVGDQLSGAQVASVLASAVGHPVGYEVQPIEELAPMGDDMIDMMRWLADTGYSADADLLARELPAVPFIDFASWAERQDWPALLAASSADA